MDIQEGPTASFPNVVAVPRACSSNVLAALAEGTRLGNGPMKGHFLAAEGAVLERSDSRWVLNETTNCLIRQARNGDIAVFGPDESLDNEDELLGSSLEREVLRVVRHRLLFSEQNRGVIVCHSAALDYRGLGIALFGSRGAGKTTWVSKILDSAPRDIRFVTGDKLFVDASSDAVARGWPGYVNIARETIDGLQSLAVIRPRLPNDAKTMITHEAYEALLKFEVSPTTTLRAIMFATPLSTPRGPEAISKSAASDLIFENVVDLITSEESDWLQLSRLPAKARADVIRTTSSAVASRVTAFVVGSGYIIEQSAQRLVDDIESILRAEQIA